MGAAVSNLIRAQDFTLTWDADGRHYLMCPGKTCLLDGMIDLEVGDTIERQTEKAWTHVDQMHSKGQP
jgi:hypothetical protein